MTSRFRLSDETRKRCTIVPADVHTMKQFRNVSPEYLGYLLDSPARVTFSLYFQVGSELIEFIKPSEISLDLLQSLIKAHDRSLDDTRICLRKKDFPAFLAYVSAIRNARITRLRAEVPGLNPKVLAVYETLSAASQLVVKGGVDRFAAEQIEEAAADLISRQLGSEDSFDTLSKLVLCDPTLYDHSASVAMFAGLLAGKIALKKRGKDMQLDATRVALSGLYHDMGKTCVPNHILNKPGQFTPEEFEIIKTHTTLGYEALLEARSMGAVIEDDVARVALEHHERFTGCGYPHGRAGRLEEDVERGIHIYSRIVSIADVYSALLMKRVYKEAYDPAQSLGIMRGLASKDFDPEIFSIFDEVVTHVTERTDSDGDAPSSAGSRHKGRIIQVG